MSAPFEMPSPFGAPDLEQLTGVVFELASQLHVERVRRIALEAALAGAGVLASGAVEALAGDPRVTAPAAEALDAAMAGIMRVLTENHDPRIPIRREAAAEA